MSNKVIVQWGSIIVFLVCVIFVIGTFYQNEIKYITLKEEVKTSAKEYINKHEVTYLFKITTEELESLGYLDELKIEDKVCIADVTVTKKWIFKKYKIDFTCITKEKTKQKVSFFIVVST